MPQHVGVHPSDRDARGGGESFEASGGGVAVHPCPGPGPQQRPMVTAGHGAVDRAAHRRWERDQGVLVSFAVHQQDPVTVHLGQGLDVGAGGLEDP